MNRTARRSTTLKGILTAASHAAFDAAVVSAHRSWRAGARVGRSLSPRHLALRLEVAGRKLAAEAEIASRR